MRLTQSVVFMTTLIDMIKEGMLIPAGFQRPYVWTKPDVLALCDSLASEFPMGGILVWKPKQDLDLASLAKPRLGPILPSDDTRATSLILDGQNRLSTLAWILATPGERARITGRTAAEAETWRDEEEIVYDHASGKILFLPHEEAVRGLRIPLRHVIHFTGRPMLELMKSWEAQGFYNSHMEEAVTGFEKISHGFREARVVLTTIEDATTDEARHAFQRICRVGVPMSVEDFDAAMSWQAGA